MATETVKLPEIQSKGQGIYEGKFKDWSPGHRAVSLLLYSLSLTNNLHVSINLYVVIVKKFVVCCTVPLFHSVFNISGWFANSIRGHCCIVFKTKRWQGK